MLYHYLREQFPKSKKKTLVLWVVLGLVVLILFFGKSNRNLQTIAVSPNEEFVACFETGNGPVVRCFRADGSLAFDYNVPSDVSAGGYCTLWFEDDQLCALFYRTERIARFSMDGSLTAVVDNTAENDPPKFPSFSKKGHQYVFEGQKIKVVYNKRSYCGYWFFGENRYLEITPKGKQSNIIYSWTAKSDNANCSFICINCRMAKGIA